MVAQPSYLPVREASPSEGPAVQFVLELGRALHRYGTPAHRLEEVMTLVSGSLGLSARFFSTPTAIFASFGEPEELRTTLIRLPPGELNLERLSRVDAIASDVVAGKSSPLVAMKRLEELHRAPPYYRPFVTVVSYALAAFSGAQLFGGQLAEIGVALVLGAVLGLIAVAAERCAAVARLFEPLAAFGVSAVAVVGTRLVGGYSTEIATLAALIFLLPGFTLTVAMTELATRNLVSGTSRITAATLGYMQLGFGVALGRQLDHLLPPVTHTLRAVPLPAWTIVPMLGVMTLALAVLFRARLKDSAYILVAGALAYGGGRLGAELFGPYLGAFLGAVLLGVGSNLIGLLFNLPTMTTLAPGTLLLVPGALGFRSLQSFMGQDVLAGVGTAFNVVMVAVAIAAGTLLANSIVPPRKML